MFVEDGPIDYVLHILLVAFCEEQKSFCISFRGRKQAFTVGVFADTFEYCTDGTGDLFEAGNCLFRGFFESFAGSSAFAELAMKYICERGIAGSYLGDSDRQSR